MRKKIIISITSIILLLSILALVIFYLFLPKETYIVTSKTESQIYNSTMLDVPENKTLDDITDLKQNLYIAQQKYFDKKFATVKITGKTKAKQLGFGINSEQLIDVLKIKNNQNQYLLMTSKGVLSSAYEVLITNKDAYNADYILRSSSKVSYTADNKFEKASWGNFANIEPKEFVSNLFGHNFTGFTEYTLNDKSIKNIELVEKAKDYSTFKVDLHVGKNVEPEFVDASKRYAKEVKTQAGSKSLPIFEKVTLKVKLSKKWDVLELTTNEIYKINKFGDVYSDTTLNAVYSYDETKIPNYDLFKKYIGKKTDNSITVEDPKEIVIKAFTQLLVKYFNKISLDANISLFGQEFDAKLQLSLIADKEVYFSIPKYNITGIYKNNKIYLDNNDNHFSLDINKLSSLQTLLNTNKKLIQSSKTFENIKEKIFENVEMKVLENKDREITLKLDDNTIILIIDNNYNIKNIDANLSIGKKNKIKAIIKPSKEYINITNINESAYQDKTDLILSLVDIFKDKKLSLKTNYIKLNDQYSLKVVSNLIYDNRLYTDTDIFIKNKNNTQIKVNIIQNGNNFYITYKDIKVLVSKQNLKNIFEFIKKQEKINFNFDLSLIDLEKSLFENISNNKNLLLQSDLSKDIKKFDFSFINKLTYNLDNKTLTINLNNNSLELSNNKDYDLNKIKNASSAGYIPLDNYLNNIEDIYNIIKDKKFNLSTNIKNEKLNLDLNLKLNLNTKSFDFSLNQKDLNNDNIINKLNLKYINNYLYINLNDRLYKENINKDEVIKFIKQFIDINKNKIPSDLLKTIDGLVFSINNNQEISLNLSNVSKILENIKLSYNNNKKSFNINISNNYNITLTNFKENIDNFDKQNYQDIKILNSILTKFIFNLDNKQLDLEKIFEILKDKTYKVSTNEILINQNYSIKANLSINLNTNYLNADIYLNEKIDQSNKKTHIFNVIYTNNKFYIKYNDIKLELSKVYLNKVINFIKTRLNLKLDFDLENLLNTNKNTNNKIDFDLNSINLDFIEKLVLSLNNNKINININDKYIIDLEKEQDLSKFEVDTNNYNNIDLYINNLDVIYDTIISKKYDLNINFKKDDYSIEARLLLDLISKYYHIDATITKDDVINNIKLTYNENTLYIQINDKLYKEEINYEKALKYINQFVDLSNISKKETNYNIFELIEKLNIRINDENINVNIKTFTNFDKDITLSFKDVDKSINLSYDIYNVSLKKLNQPIIPNDKDYTNINILNKLITDVNFKYNNKDKLEYFKNIYKIIETKKYHITTNDIKINEKYTIKVEANIDLNTKNIYADIYLTELLKTENNKHLFNIVYKDNKVYLKYNELKVNLSKQNINKILKFINTKFNLDINFDLGFILNDNQSQISKFDFDLSKIKLDFIKKLDIALKENNTLNINLNNDYILHITKLEDSSKFEVIDNDYHNIDLYINNLDVIYDTIMSKKYDLNINFNKDNYDIKAKLLIDLTTHYYHIDATITKDAVINKVILTYRENTLYININDKLYKEEIQYEKALNYIKQFIDLTNKENNYNIFELINKLNIRFEDKNILVNLTFIKEFLNNVVLSFDNKEKSINIQLNNYNVSLKQLNKTIIPEKEKYTQVNILNKLIDNLHFNFERQNKLEYLKDLYNILSKKKYNIKSVDFIKLSEDYQIKFDSNVILTDKITTLSNITLKDKNQKTLDIKIYSEGNEFYIEFKGLKVRINKDNLANLLTQIKQVFSLKNDFNLSSLNLEEFNKVSKFDINLANFDLSKLEKLNITKENNLIKLSLNDTYNLEVKNIEDIEKPNDLNIYKDISKYTNNFEKIYNLFKNKKYSLQLQTNIDENILSFDVKVDLIKNDYKAIITFKNKEEHNLFNIELLYSNNTLYTKVNNKKVKENVDLNKLKEKFISLLSLTQANSNTSIIDYINQIPLTIKEDQAINLDLSMFSEYLKDINISYDDKNNSFTITKQDYSLLLKELKEDITLTEEQQKEYEQVNYISQLLDKIILDEHLVLNNDFVNNLKQTISTSYSINLTYKKDNIDLNITGKIKVLPKVSLDLVIKAKYKNYLVNATLKAKDNKFLLTANNLKFYLTFDEILELVKKLNNNYVNNSINEDQLAFLKNVIEYIRNINISNQNATISLTNNLNIILELASHKILIQDTPHLEATLSKIEEDIEVEVEKADALGYDKVSKLFDIKEVIENVRKKDVNNFVLDASLEKDGKKYTAKGSIKTKRVGQNRIDIELKLDIIYNNKKYTINITMVNDKVYLYINKLKLAFNKDDLNSSILTILKALNINIPYLDSILKSTTIDIDTKFFEKMFESSETEILSYINSLSVENDTLYTVDVKSSLISSVKDFHNNFKVKLTTSNKNFNKFELVDMYIGENQKMNLSLESKEDNSDIVEPVDKGTYKEVLDIKKLVKSIVKTASLKKYKLKGSVDVSFSGGLLMNGGTITFEAEIKLDEKNNPEFHIKAFVPYLGEKSKLGYITDGQFNIEFYYKDGKLKVKDKFEYRSHWWHFKSPVVNYFEHDADYFKEDKNIKIMNFLHLSDKVKDSMKSQQSDYKRSEDDLSKLVKDVKNITKDNQTNYNLVLNASELLASSGFGDLNLNLFVDNNDYINKFSFKVDYNFLLADWLTLTGNVNLIEIGQDFEINMPQGKNW